MQVFNTFTKSLLFFFLLSFTSLSAGNCNNISGLNGTDQTISKILEVDVSNNNAARYYKFRTSVDGSLNMVIDKYGNKENVKFSDNKCDGNKVYQKNNSNNVSEKFSISADTTYYIKIQEKNWNNDLKFKMTLTFTKSLPYGGEAESICYGESTTDGEKTTTPINSLEDNLENVIVYFDTSSLFSIPFFDPGIDDCSVDNGAKSENCEEHENGNAFGPVSMFNDGGWTFDLGDVSRDEDHSISTYDGGSFFDMIADLFSSQSALKATYVKDGYLYTGTIASCGDLNIPAEPEDEVVPNQDPQPQIATCDTFADMFQTRGNCTGTSGGTVKFTNAGAITDGSTNIIIDNNDKELNTCQTTVPNWVKNQFETCGESGDCTESGIAAESLTIIYDNVPEITNISTSPTSSTDDIVLDGTITLSGYDYNSITTSSNTDTTTTFNITNQLKINTLKMTTGNIFSFTSSEIYSLDIGTLGVQNNGAGNTITTDSNAKNIKISNFDLPATTTLSLEASQTIKMNTFTVGRDSTVTLKAPFININEFVSSNSGEGASNLIIYADYLDLGNLTLGQTVTLTIYPYTTGKRILFRTNTLEESSSSSIIINSGNYYVNSTLIIPGTSDISALRAIDGNQIINFYINDTLTLGNNPGINATGNNGNYDSSFPAANFMIFINGDLETGGGGTTINATLYVENDVTLDNPTYIKGAISAQNISIGQGQFTYDQSLDDAGFGKCEDNFECANPKEFLPVYSDNTHSKLLLIGNTSLCSNSGGQCSDPGSSRNNNINMMNNDFDGDAATTVNSSAAYLDIPDGKKVLWAGLFWQGYFAGNFTDEEKRAAKTIKYKHENGSYITTSNTEMNWVYFSGTRMYYQSYIELTDYVDNNGGGYYWIGDIITTEGQPAGGSFGAWSLAVVYQDDDEVLKNTTVFHGYRAIAGNGDINNALTYANNHGCDTNTGVGNNVSSTLDNFLTPKTNRVESNLIIFSGEGDLGAKGDHGYLSDISGTKHELKNALNPKDDIMNATISTNGVSVTNGKPFYSTNSLGADIDTYDVSSILENNQTSTEITFNTVGDGYMPGVYALETQLYEPRVCYFLDTIVDEHDFTIFENATFKPDTDISAGEKYTFNFLISNMKKDINETDLETADLVQIYLNMTNFSYEEQSTHMKNIGENDFSDVTDLNATNGIKDDLGEYLSNKSTWRVGESATHEKGGTLAPANNFQSRNITYVNIKGSLSIDGNSTSINLTDFLNFKASFKTPTLEIKEKDAVQIAQCQDFDTNTTVSAPASSYNAVQTNFNYPKDPLLTENSSAQDKARNALPTQISARNFWVKIVSLDPDDKETLSPSTGDVNVSIIQTPSYTGNIITDQILCDNSIPITIPVTVPINNKTDENILLLNTTAASRNASIKITSKLTSDTPIHSCSRDVFAIRPEKFVLTSPNKDITLLHSGVQYNLTLLATQSGNIAPTPNYNVLNAQNIFTNIDANKVIYAPDGTIPNPPLAGTLAMFQNNFNIMNGQAINAVGISFDNVGEVKIELVDQNWSKVDIDNGDTSLDCNNTNGNIGAYICGSKNARFIPDHFTLTNASLINSGASAFTYLAKDLNITAGISLTIKAENAQNNKTSNFDFTAWENPVDITFTIPAQVGLNSNPNGIDKTLKLNFNGGEKAINYSDTNTSENLIFNYSRNSNIAINPFSVNGADITVIAVSTYTSSAVPAVMDHITGTVNPDQNVTFIYGRTHTPRQKFIDSGNTPVNHDALIYYEAFCSGAGCDKTLLPDGAASTFLDDPRWFTNTQQIATEGTAGIVTEKTASGAMTIVTEPTGTHQDKTTVKYDGTKGYPLTKTMKNAASHWLVYDKYNPAADHNEFVLEFYKDAGGYVGSGKSTADVKVKKSTTLNTNENKSWW